MKKLIIAVFLIIPVILSAQDIGGYYVSLDGNDSNDGSYANPWRTWAKAFNATELSPGDTVYFRGGVYHKRTDLSSLWYYGGDYVGAGYNVTVNGTEGNRIVFMAYPGETPILDSDNVIPENTLHYAIRGSADYIEFNGLTVRNVWQVEGGVGGVNVNVTSWRMSGIVDFKNCVVYNAHGTGFSANGGIMNYVNCDAYNLSDSLAVSPVLPGNGGTGFGAIIRFDTNSSLSYDSCRSWNTGDQGIAAGSIGMVKITNSWFMFNGQLQGGGHGIKAGFVNTEEDMTTNIREIKNNLLVYNREIGYNQNCLAKKAIPQTVYNNIAYKNGYSNYNALGYGFAFFNTSSSDALELMQIVKNNISYDNDDGALLQSTGALITDEYNTWNDPPNVTVTDADFVALPSDSATAWNLLTAPRQADGSLPSLGNYFQLAEGSSLIDAGTDVGLDYNGTAPDLGAFEYGTATASTATDITSFSLSEQTGAATINATNHTVSIEVANGTTVTSLTPTIGVSSGATISPTSGTAQNFTSPVTYTVTAQDETTTQEWTVTVTAAEAISRNPISYGGKRLFYNAKYVK